MVRTICRVDGCPKKLRSDNRTGVCKLHRNRWGSCRRCYLRCDWRSTLCKRCNLREKKLEADHMITCWAQGCRARVRSKSGYCREHWLNGKKCLFEGCSVMVIINSKHGYCRSHDFMASRIRYRQKRQRELYP